MAQRKDYQLAKTKTFALERDTYELLLKYAGLASEPILAKEKLIAIDPATKAILIRLANRIAADAISVEDAGNHYTSKTVEGVLQEIGSMEDGENGISGPAVSTDNAVARWDGIGGNTLQNSGVILDDLDNITGVGNLTLAEYIRHTGDLDTYLHFTDDRFRVVVGNLDILDITELPAAQDIVVWNNGEADVDFRIAAFGATNALFVRGSDGFVGIGTNAPDTELHVEGDITAEGVWDDDQDTGIQLEEGVDEDKIRFDMAGVERVVWHGKNAAGNVMGWWNQHFSNLLDPYGGMESWSAGTPADPDGWTSAGAPTIAKDADERYGHFAAKITFVAAAASLYRDIEEFAFFQSRIVTLGAWIKTGTANIARIRISDGVASTDSPFHTGGGNYEWLTVTRTINGGATRVRAECRVEAAGNALFDGVILVDGAICPTYMPAVKPIFLRDDMSDGNWDGDAKSDGDSTVLDLSAFGNGLPPNIKAVLFTLGIKDSGSAGAPCFARVGPDIVDSHCLWHFIQGVPNGVVRTAVAWVPCDPNGDVYIQIDATGVNTMNVWIWIWGYILGE